MIGNASRIPTPRKKNVKMLPRASGWRAIASTALEATIPSPTAEPRATAATIRAKPRIRTAATTESGLTVDLSLMFLGRCQGEIDDGEQREDERLNRTDQEVEELDPDRGDRRDHRDVHRPYHDVRRDDRGDHEQQQFAGQDVERQAHREHDRASDLLDQVDREQKHVRLEEVRIRLDPALANGEELDADEDADRERGGRVEIGGRRAAEREPQRLEEEDAELVQDPNE